MVFRGNEQVTKDFKKFLMDIGISQREVSRNMGVSPQLLAAFLTKKNLSFADIDRALQAIGYELHYDFVQKE